MSVIFATLAFVYALHALYYYKVWRELAPCRTMEHLLNQTLASEIDISKDNMDGENSNENSNKNTDAIPMESHVSESLTVNTDFKSVNEVSDESGVETASEACHISIGSCMSDDSEGTYHTCYDGYYETCKSFISWLNPESDRVILTTDRKLMINMMIVIVFSVADVRKAVENANRSSNVG